MVIYLGTFLADLRAVPTRVTHYVARQLEISEVDACLERYQASQMRHDHVADLTSAYAYRSFTDARATFPLARLLYLRTWTGVDRPSALFDEAVEWLRTQKVLLPGVTTLTRFVARVRDRATARVWRELSGMLTGEQRERLERILTATEEDGGPRLEVLRRGETRVSAPALVRALERLEITRGVGVQDVDLGHLQASRLKALAAYAITSKATTIANLSDDRRMATLLAFARMTELTACDDALELWDTLMDTILRTAQNASKQERLRTLRDLDAAALLLADVNAPLLDHLPTPISTASSSPTPIPSSSPGDTPTSSDSQAPDLPDSRTDGAASRAVWSDAEVRGYLLAHRDEMGGAIAQITALARPAGETYQQELRGKYHTVRRFLPQLLHTIDFAATHAGRPLQEALHFLMRIEQQYGGKRVPAEIFDAAPREFVPAAWSRHVAPPGKSVDRPMYTLCFLAQLQQGLRTRDIFVPTSTRWSDPRAQLLQGAEWERARPTICQLLRRSADADEEVGAWATELDAAYRHAAVSLPADVRVTMEKDAKTGKVHPRLHLGRLEAMPESPSLQRLRLLTDRSLPLTHLPAILLEIDARTQFTEEFTHIGEGRPRLDEFSVSLCAALMAQACNLPISAVAQPGTPALEADRLVHVQQNYMRKETLARANARLVESHTQIPLTTVWGGGEVASVDGLRFVVPVRAVNSGPAGKYFGPERGITLINFTQNHFFGFNGAIVTGALRDSLHVLDGLLEQDAPLLQPQEIMSDSSSYSDVIFGLFSLLGYRFSPRLAELSDTRFWRFPQRDATPADISAAYGALDLLSRHRLDRNLITTNWDDVLRVVGSIKLGRVRPSEALRILQTGGRPTTLGRAIGEIGRIAKTFYLLEYLVDQSYRRRIQIQLNRGESRHSLARVVFHGRRGELRQPYREGQEEQLGALGLVVNIVILWNTLYLDRALADLRRRHTEVLREDVERLSPLGHDHIIMTGTYTFALAEAVRRGGYLPLREWDETDLTFS